jgi:hypothetical protein
VNLIISLVGIWAGDRRNKMAKGSQQYLTKIIPHIYLTKRKLILLRTNNPEGVES